MPIGQEINQKNLRRLCWANGVTVTEFCRRIGRSRKTVYGAAKQPALYPVAYGLMRSELLGVREGAR